jgi:hypothetical protein
MFYGFGQRRGDVIRAGSARHPSTFVDNGLTFIETLRTLPGRHPSRSPRAGRDVPARGHLFDPIPVGRTQRWQIGVQRDLGSGRRGGMRRQLRLADPDLTQPNATPNEHLSTSPTRTSDDQSWRLMPNPFSG